MKEYKKIIYFNGGNAIYTLESEIPKEKLIKEYKKNLKKKQFIENVGENETHILNTKNINFISIEEIK